MPSPMKMAKKAPGKAKKSTAKKPVPKQAGGAVKKRRVAKKHDSYAHYVKQILANRPNLNKDEKPATITQEALNVVDAIADDLFNRLATEASESAYFSNIKTLKSGAMVAAIKMHFPDEMASHALSAGVAAVSKYAKAQCCKSKPKKFSAKKLSPRK